MKSITCDYNEREEWRMGLIEFKIVTVREKE